MKAMCSTKYNGKTGPTTSKNNALGLVNCSLALKGNISALVLSKALHESLRQLIDA